MTEDAAYLPDGDQEATNVVGARVLAGIQMINISRLSAHPVPMVSGGLVTVAGQGPKDSNGAGKSSFIAGISLLSGDEQWRWSSGAPDAAELLFTAEIAAQDGRWGNAAHGYIIGVFTAPDAAAAGELTASALTVWLRINRKAPYIDLRWASELYVPTGASDADRVAAADGMWAELPRRNGRHDIHANRLGQALYGRHVRCVSFLSTSVRASATANLLAQPLNELSPARIFDAIAALTGIDREMEQERATRTTEHARREEEQRARADLERWEAEAADRRGRHRPAGRGPRRDRARGRAVAGPAAPGWSWTERDQLDDIGTGLARLETEWETRAAELGQLRDQLRDLRSDEAFQAYCAGAEDAWKQISERGPRARGRRADHGPRHRGENPAADRPPGGGPRGRRPRRRPGRSRGGRGQRPAGGRPAGLRGPSAGTRRRRDRPGRSHRRRRRGRRAAAAAPGRRGHRRAAAGQRRRRAAGPVGGAAAARCPPLPQEQAATYSPPCFLGCWRAHGGPGMRWLPDRTKPQRK